MLFDPKWEAKSASSLKGFVAWLETKDPAERYDWLDPHGCAVAQYHRSIGQNNPEIWLMGSLDAIAWGGLGRSNEWTFGHCLDRARARMAA